MLWGEAIGINQIVPDLTCRKLLKTYEYQIYHKFPLPSCFCGIEVEVENIADGVAVPKEIWLAKVDNSLRNGGLEYISRPVSGNDLVNSLELFFTKLPEHASFSQRTSIHVHVNALDLTPDEITKFVLLYLLFEKVLYRFVGKDRDRNIFCVPVQDTYRVKTVIESLRARLTRGEPIEDEEHRYAGLNLACLHTFGTLEFRQLGGTRDVNLILAWIDMLQCLRRAAEIFDYNELIGIIKELNTTSDYHSFLFRVFESTSNHFDLSHASKDIERGVCSVKTSLLSNSFENELANGRSYNSKGIRILTEIASCAE